MRWLVVHPGPEFSVADVFNGWVEALTAAGEQVATFNMNDRLMFYNACLLETGQCDEKRYPLMKKALTVEQAITLAANGLLSACYQWWPDVILMVSAFFVPAAFLPIFRERGHKLVLYHTESPYQDDEQLRRAQYASVNLLNDPVNLAAYQQLGPAAYMPHAYRPGLHKPGPALPEMVCDLTFNGTGFPSRVKFFEDMTLDGLDVMLTGNWQELPDSSKLARYLAHEKDRCLDNEQVVQTYRSARCGLNLYRREFGPTNIPMAEADKVPLDIATAEGWAMGPREVEMAASGLFFLRDPRGESDEVLPMLPSFGSPGEAGELLRWYLDRPLVRAAKAQQARRAVAGRTFDANLRELLRLLDKQPVTIT